MNPKSAGPIAGRRLGRWVLIPAIVFPAFLSLIPLSWAAADVGPRPTLTLVFDFSALAAPVEFDEVRLYCCDDLGCTGRQPLQDVPGQRLECDGQRCRIALLTACRLWQVEAAAADGVRVSPAFEKSGYYSVYRMVVLEDTLEIVFVSASEPGLEAALYRPQAVSLVLLAGLALGATLTVEIVIAAAYLGLARLPLRLLAAVAVVNVLTLPLIWLVVPFLPVDAWLGLAAGLVAVVLVETILLKLLGRGRLSWRHAGVLSALMNAASALLGLTLVPG